MRAIHFGLLALAVLGGAGVAHEIGNNGNTGSKETDPAPIHFDLAAPKPARPESLPTVATLGELTYATENRLPAKSAARAAAKAAAKPAPRPARKVVAAKPAKGPWMSEWRRAYLAWHGHQPPVPPR